MKETIENKSTLNVFSFFFFLHFLMHIFIYLSYCSHNDFVIILSMQHLLINYINVGVILYVLHETKYVRGSLLPVEIFPSSTDRNVLGMSSKNIRWTINRFRSMSIFFGTRMGQGQRRFQGPRIFFSVRGYKELLGKPFNSLQLFVCSKDKYDSSK